MSEHVNLGEVLPGLDLDLEPGTNVGIIGPTMTGKHDIATELLASRHKHGDGIICITTKNDARQFVSSLASHVPDLDEERVAIIDCSGSESQEVIRGFAEFVSSPGDLTGISIATAKLHKQLTAQQVDQVQYGVISVTSLLQYMDAGTVFKFLHVYSRRVNDTGAIGIYTLDSDAHNPTDVNTIRGLFDGVIEIRDTEAGDIEYRRRGFGKRPSAWQPFD